MCQYYYGENIIDSRQLFADRLLDIYSYLMAERLLNAAIMAKSILITNIDNNKKLYKICITIMFYSTACSRQFHRYDLEYIKLLPVTTCISW